MNNLTQEMDGMSVSEQSGQTTPRGQGTNTTVPPNAPARVRRSPTANPSYQGINLSHVLAGNRQVPGGRYRKRRRKSRKSRRKSRKSKKRRRKKSKKKRRKSRKSKKRRR